MSPESQPYSGISKIELLLRICFFNRVASALRDEHEAITPGCLMNQRHGNELILDGSFSGELVIELIGDSFPWVLAGHPRATRERVRAALDK